MRKRIVSYLLLCTMMTTIPFSIAIPCSADMVYIVHVIDDGGGLHNGSQISMPYADVRINITNFLHYAIVNQSARFEIFTNQTQNATLAFVYPHYLPYTGDMQILANETEIEFVLLTWDELVKTSFSNDSELVTQYWNFTTIYSSFACFEVNLCANTTIFFHIFSNYVFTTEHIVTLEGRDSWEYRYIFGSARTFDGDTLQNIHIHLVEEEPLTSKHFNPLDYLTLIEDGNQTDAIWEFNVSSLELNYITFTFGTPFTPNATYDIGTTILIWTSIITVVITTIAFFIHRRRTS